MTSRQMNPWVGIAASLALQALCPSSAWAAISWINASGGAWSNPSNWDGAVVPGALDSAIVTLAGTYTVTLDVNASVASLTLGGARPPRSTPR